MPAGLRPVLALVIAHHDDATRRTLIDAVSTPGSGIAVVGIAGEALAGHALVRRAAPDVALIEIGLPGAGGVGDPGLAVARALADELPACAVVLAGTHERAAGGGDVGAAGWVDPAAPPDEVARVVRAVSRRESAAHPRWVRAALAGGDVEDLDPLDRTVLEAMARGDHVPAVADRLGLTAHQVGRRAHDALGRLTTAGRRLAPSPVVAGCGSGAPDPR